MVYSRQQSTFGAYSWGSLSPRPSLPWRVRVRCLAQTQNEPTSTLHDQVESVILRTKHAQCFLGRLVRCRGRRGYVRRVALKAALEIELQLKWELHLVGDLTLGAWR